MNMGNPYVGIIISFVFFGIGSFLFKKTKSFFLFTPLFVAMILGIVFLKITGISYEEYNQGGKIITFFLEPATVAFAVPLYKKREVLKEYWLEIIAALTIGSLVSLLSLVIVGQLMQMNDSIIASILPQAATTAIAVPISVATGGIGEITAFCVILSGVLVYALGKTAIQLFHIKNPISKGLALGASGKTLGVAISMELGETEAAMGSISVVIVGVVTAVVVPIFAKLMGIG